MKYYKLIKTKNGKLTEIERKDMKIDTRPAKIYQTKSAYFGIGEASRKFLQIIEKVQFKTNKNIEDYWDKVASNWIEEMNQKERKN